MFPSGIGRNRIRASSRQTTAMACSKGGRVRKLRRGFSSFSVLSSQGDALSTMAAKSARGIDRLAITFGSQGAGQLSASPFPAAGVKSRHYETITGADTLALALIELHLQVLHITAVRCPPNTIDR